MRYLTAALLALLLLSPRGALAINANNSLVELKPSTTSRIAGFTGFTYRDSSRIVTSAIDVYNADSLDLIFVISDTIDVDSIQVLRVAGVVSGDEPYSTILAGSLPSTAFNVNSQTVRIVRLGACVTWGASVRFKLYHGYTGNHKSASGSATKAYRLFVKVYKKA